MTPACGVVTLTTDFGLEDNYVGTMKGVLLQIYPEVRTIDITHQVHPQDALEASLVLQGAYPYFPMGTVHLSVVDPGVGSDRRPIVVVTEAYYFVGPDNGTFTRIIESSPDAQIFQIENPRFMLQIVSDTFHGRDIFAPAAAYLARGVAPEEFGPAITDPLKTGIPVPRVYGDQIAGEVIYIDSFGNVITNISRNRFDQTFGDQAIRISINGKTIDRIDKNYADGERGRTLALFGSSELLEIAVAGDRADRRIGAGKGDTVLVDIVRGAGGAGSMPGFDF